MPEVNPKQTAGIAKVSLSYVPSGVMMELALGMMEGGYKYGRHNFRAVGGILASVYYDATIRHLMAWWEGENFDPQSRAGLHHVSKAIASLTVLRDAMMSNKFVDDRPPATLSAGWIEGMSETVKQLQAAFPNPVPPYVTDSPDKPIPTASEAAE